jgi:hypothetical protein
MPKNVVITDATELGTIPLPQQTKTYTVVSHPFIINETKEQLKLNGFEIKSEEYCRNLNGEVALGIYHLVHGNDPELGLMFTWANSYDKSMRFRCAIGGYVKISGSRIIAGDMSNYGRIHTGDAKDQVKEHIESQIKSASSYFSALCADKDNMKDYILSDETIAELMGLLYFKDVLSVSQLINARAEYKKPSFEYGVNSEVSDCCDAPVTSYMKDLDGTNLVDAHSCTECTHDCMPVEKLDTEETSLWTIYNHCILALKKAHPKSWMEQQKDLHKVIKARFLDAPVSATPSIVNTEIEETVVDPAQTNLLDQIEEIEAEAEVKAAPDTFNLDHINLPEEDPIEDETEETVLDEDLNESEVDDADSVLEQDPNALSLDAHNTEYDADAEMQDMKTDLIMEERATEDEVSEQLYGVNNNEEEITGSFPEAPADLPVAESNQMVEDTEETVEKLVQQINDDPSTQELKDAIDAAEAEEVTPLEEQVAGETVQPVSEEEKEVSAPPIVDEPESNEVKQSTDLDFLEEGPTEDSFISNDEESSNEATLESPFEY